MKLVGHKSNRGFTIVELLIVIIVIGILAAIIFLAYGNIRAQAINTVNNASANQLVKLLTLYNTKYQKAPATDASRYCLSTDNACTESGGYAYTSDNTAMISELTKVGTLPDKYVKVTGKYWTTYGFYYAFFGGATMDSRKAEQSISYYLQGDNVKCGVGSVASDWSAQNVTTSTTGYTYSADGITGCRIMILNTW